MGKRFSIRALLVTTLLFAICCAAVVAVRQSIVGRFQSAQRLGTLIDKLYSRQPQNLTVAQWRCMVDWTRNLHGNSLIAHQTSTSQIVAFETRIEKRLSGNVDADTIEWIWDEYAKICQGGQNYQKFRLMLNEDLIALKSSILLESPEENR